MNEIKVSGTWNGIAVEVEGEFTPATPDVRYLPNGDPGYPGDPAEWDAVVSFQVEDPATFERYLERVDPAWYEDVIDYFWDDACEEFANRNERDREDFLASQAED